MNTVILFILLFIGVGAGLWPVIFRTEYAALLRRGPKARASREIDSTIIKMQEKLDSIKTCVEKFARIIEAPENLLPTYGNYRECHPNVEVNANGQLSYEIYERGKAIQIDYALDDDHLLYLIFRGVTYSMAIKFANEHQDSNIDNRQIKFQKQLELLGRMNEAWQKREKEIQDVNVLEFPFKNYDGRRQAYLRELMGNGFLYEEALQKANEKYP